MTVWQSGMVSVLSESATKPASQEPDMLRPWDIHWKGFIMTAKKLLIYLSVQVPIGLMIGIVCTFAYSLEFETSVSINWPAACLIALLIVAFSIGREMRDLRKSHDLQRGETTH
jgi:hypothetical protein